MKGLRSNIYLSGDESDHILVKKGLLQNISSCNSPFFTFFRENSDRLQRASGVSDKSIGSLETVSREKIFRKLARISAVCRLKIASSLDAAKERCRSKQILNQKQALIAARFIHFKLRQFPPDKLSNPQQLFRTVGRHILAGST